MDHPSQNKLAVHFAKLHIPGQPVVLANVYDGATAKIVASNPAAKAIATASNPIAATEGIADEELTWEQNIARIRTIGSVVAKSGLPLSVDVQDGYADIPQTIRAILNAGAVGCNLEDVDSQTGELRTAEEAIERIKLAKKVAADAGVPDFVINARTDTLAYDGSIEDAISRGRAYIAAGATTAFVWGGPGGRGVRTAEVEQLVNALGGRLNVLLKMSPGSLTIPELRQVGVARVSVGPRLFMAAMEGYTQAANELLTA